jgi:glycosyltransferase involved in cell wall biosynthesis
MSPDDTDWARGRSPGDAAAMPVTDDDGARSSSGTHTELISIVVPVYNEAEGIVEFNRRLTEVRTTLAERTEVVYVNDGSKDDTRAILERLREHDPAISIVNLSRNFGKEIALTAGLDHSRGDAIVVIDADLQDPPELIPSLITRWREQHADVVFAQRRSRAGETWFKKATAFLFYRVMNALGQQPVPVDTGDFRLLSRRAADAVRMLREQHRFMKGLFAWVGFRQVAVPYERDRRLAGRSKWNYWKLWNLSLEAITSFSLLPLKMATYVGLFTAIVAVCYGFYIIGLTILFGNSVAGYPSLLVVILFLGGVQLVSLGIIGEYLGRVFNETKHRPLYFIDEVLPARLPKSRSPRAVDGSSPADDICREPILRA